MSAEREGLWRTWDTCPQDGRAVLARFDDLYCETVCRTADGWYWYEDGDTSGTRTPTHWMPVPAEPVSEPEPCEHDWEFIGEQANSEGLNGVCRRCGARHHDDSASVCKCDPHHRYAAYDCPRHGDQSHEPEPDARYVVEERCSWMSEPLLHGAGDDTEGAIRPLTLWGARKLARLLEEAIGPQAKGEELVTTFRILPVGPAPRVEPTLHQFREWLRTRPHPVSWKATLLDVDYYLDSVYPEPVGRARESITIHGDMDTVELLDLIARGYVEEAAQKAKAMAGRAPESEVNDD